MGAVLFSRSIVVSKGKCFLNLELHNLSLRQNPEPRTQNRLIVSERRISLLSKKFAIEPNFVLTAIIYNRDFLVVLIKRISWLKF